jgi:hypothetical protein
MDQGPLVERQINDGLCLAQELARDDFDVTAAFWLKEGEDGQWFLYIASRDVDEKGPIAAYGIMAQTLRRKPDLGIGPFDVKLIEASSPITQDVLRIRRPTPGIPSHFYGSYLGKHLTDEAYIYGPVPAPEKAGA